MVKILEPISTPAGKALQDAATEAVIVALRMIGWEILRKNPKE